MTLDDDLSSENDATAAKLTVLRWLDLVKKPRRKKWNRQTVGRTRQRLAKRLIEAGIPIPSADLLWCQQGGFRTKHWDVAKWGADFQDDAGTWWHVYSWDTMTACASRGIIRHTDSRSDCEVSAQ